MPYAEMGSWHFFGNSSGFAQFLRPIFDSYSIHSSVTSGKLESYVGIHSTVSSGCIQLFHRDTIDCFIGIHATVSSAYKQQFVRFLKKLCNVSAISAATIPNADCINTQFVQQ